MNANIFEKANQTIKTANTAYVGVIDENGFPSVSTVMVIDPENIFEVHFPTGLASNKVKRLTKDSRASVCFHIGGNNITLVGEAEILTDQQTKSRFWRSADLTAHFPGGETDPNFCIVRIKTKRVSLWVDNEDAQFTIDQLLKVQSYCGLLCDGCTYRETHGCVGCHALKGRPFWGECPIALCCQNKGYTHCGECDEIPCDLVKDFSCGEDEHSDKPPGARIAVCRAWKTQA